MALPFMPPETDAATRPIRRLRRVQRWLQSAIVTPGPAGDVIAHPDCQKEFPVSASAALIRPSWSLTSLERLDIYRDMYQSRLLAALRVDYPLLQQYLGDDLFEELGRLYIREYPSTSYTLNRFGDRLPAFVRELDGPKRPTFVYDLARYELARTEVFDEQESSLADPGCMAAIPSAHWERLRMQPIAALRLLKLRYPVHELATHPDFPESANAVKSRRCYLAVYRRDYAVLAIRLTAPGFAMLQALMEGEMLGEAMQQMFAAGGCREQDIFQYFQQWISERLFAHVGVP